MQHVHFGAEGLGEEEGVVYRFRLADGRAGGLPVHRVGLALLLDAVQVVVHDLPVLGVDAQRQPGLGDVPEHVLAHAVVREGQVADGLAEEDLVAHRSDPGHGQDLVGVGLHHHAQQREIQQRLLLGQPLLLLHLLGMGHRRDRVGHVHHAGDAPGDGGAGAGAEVFLVGHAGLAEVDVPVDQPGQDMLAPGVDLAGAFRQRVVGADGHEFFVVDGDTAVERVLGRHHGAVLDHQICLHGCSLRFGRAVWTDAGRAAGGGVRHWSAAAELSARQVFVRKNPA